jgi:hypothetical protein
MIASMEPLHISEGDAVRDLAAILKRPAERQKTPPVGHGGGFPNTPQPSPSASSRPPSSNSFTHASRSIPVK